MLVLTTLDGDVKRFSDILQFHVDSFRIHLVYNTDDSTEVFYCSVSDISSLFYVK